MKFITAESGLALPPCAATIGCFDGVHRGHRYLIDQVRREALARGLHSALITFPVHPRQVMQSGYCPQWLTCLPQKKELLQQEDADYCILLPFTHELSLLPARRFMELLHTRFNVQALVIGYDHRFGHNRSEGFADYCRYGKELGIEVVHARALVEDGVSISSSLIRTLLKQGDAVRANRCLGYRYYLDGKVVSGYQVGRKLGFPTANLQPSCPDKLVPREGVYAVYAYVGDNRYPGMLNIGRRPTVDNGTERSIEVHIIGFEADIYQHALRVEFVQYIRPEQKFEGIEALIAQLNRDKEEIARLLCS